MGPRDSKQQTNHLRRSLTQTAAGPSVGCIPTPPMYSKMNIFLSRDNGNSTVMDIKHLTYDPSNEFLITTSNSDKILKKRFYM